MAALRPEPLPVTETTEYKVVVRKNRITDKELKKEFEQQLLDGDKVEDCGGAMVSAEEAWSFVEGVLEENCKDAYEEGLLDGARLPKKPISNYYKSQK